MCEESGEVDVDKMREDISTAFMGFDFDWKSALLTCSAVKFPMLCSLTERVQEDLDSKFRMRLLLLFEFSLVRVRHFLKIRPRNIAYSVGRQLAQKLL